MSVLNRALFLAEHCNELGYVRMLFLLLLLFLLLKPVEVPQVQFWMRLSSCPLRADSFGVQTCRKLWFFTVAVSTRGRCPCSCSSLTVVDVPVLLQRRLGSCWRCLSLSSSPELVVIPATETGVRLGSGGDEGVGAHHTGDKLN